MNFKKCVKYDNINIEVSVWRQGWIDITKKSLVEAVVRKNKNLYNTIYSYGSYSNIEGCCRCTEE